MITPERRAQMDAVLGVQSTQKSTLTPERRSQMDAVLGISTPEPEQKSIGGFIKNIGKSAVSNVGQIGSAILSPIQTAKNIGKLAVGTAQLAIPGEQGYEQSARDVGQFYKQRYGGLKNIGETLYNDPVGALLDVSTVAGGVGTAAKLGKFGKVAEVAGNIERATQPLNIAKSIFKKVPGVEKAGGKIFGTASEIADDLNLRSTKLSKNQITKVEDVTKMPIKDYLNEIKLYGSTKDKLSQLESKIETAQGKFNKLTRTDKVVPVKLYADEIRKRAIEILNKDRSPEGRSLAEKLWNEADDQEKIGNLTDTVLTNTTSSSFGKAKGSLQDPLAVNFRKELAIAGKEARELIAKGSGKIGKELEGYRALAKNLTPQENLGKTTQIFNAFKPSFAGAVAGAGLGSFVPVVGNVAGGAIGAISSILANNPSLQGKLAKLIKTGKKPAIFSKAAKTGRNIEMFGKTGRLLQPQN